MSASMIWNTRRLVLALAVLAASQPAAAASGDAELERFSAEMVQRHGIEAQFVRRVLGASERRDDILERISNPAEALPWHRYRPIFVKPERIREGVEYWRRHRGLLDEISERFGVPAHVLVAIVGVETRYGTHAGGFRVIDALRTLGFDYPPRADFFRRELEEFLLLTREEGIDPLQPVGSYAGAMGVPQFISSSYRAYAVDYNDNGVRDLWGEPGDALGSVANYLSRHGWREGQPVAVPARVSGEAWRQALDSGLKPRRTVAQLRDLGVAFQVDVPADTPARLLTLESGPGQTEFWVTFHNFYVITRYNHSPLYAMAVLQLAEAVRERRAEN